MLSSLISQDGRAVLEAIMRHVPSGLTLAAAPDVTLLRVSDYGSRLLGRARAALEGIDHERHVDAFGIFDPATGAPPPPERLPLTRAVRQGEVVRDEEWLITDGGGNRIPVLCSAGPIKDAAGDVIGGVIAWTDLRQQKRMQRDLAELVKQRDLLIREIHHRIKNHLSIVASIIQMEATRHGPECRAFADSVQRRMDVLAAVHSTAYRSEDVNSVEAAEHLRRICECLSSDAHQVVVVSEAGLRIPNHQATALALIANEAVCNALRHAFPDSRAGRVEVVLRRRGDALVLTVTDNGIGPPAQRSSAQKLGLILANGLARQVGGETTLRRGRKGGAVFTLRFPLDGAPAARPTPQPGRAIPNG